MKTFTQDIFTPNTNYANEYQGSSTRALFVCSAGLLRSPTAAKVAICEKGWNARACGSHEEYALIPLSATLIYWADRIFFVNQENYDRALETFSENEDSNAGTLLVSKATVWDLPDQYSYDHPDLVEIISKLLVD